MAETRHNLLRPRSYGGLMMILVLVIVVSPVLDTIRFGSRILDMLFVLALLSAIRDIAGDQRRHRWMLAVGAVAVVGRITSALWQTPPMWISVLAVGSTMALFLIAIWSISHHVFRERSVSTDTIRGAICVYLLLGFVWTLSYVVVASLDPSAFPDIDPLESPAASYNGLQYFSFVTLTTLGYGDITPHGNAARQLAMAEAIVGQLYIAVAIAWLVGMYRGAGDRGSEPSDRQVNTDSRTPPGGGSP
jgi:hypothetical protein